MTDQQWELLLSILSGELLDPLPLGFLVDGPWMAADHGVSLMDYLTSNDVWFQANLAAQQRYPDVL